MAKDSALSVGKYYTGSSWGERAGVPAELTNEEL
jgi:hypothetical protein